MFKSGIYHARHFAIVLPSRFCFVVYENKSFRHKFIFSDYFEYKLPILLFDFDLWMIKDQTILLCSMWKGMQVVIVRVQQSSYPDKFHQKYQTSPTDQCEGICILNKWIVFWRGVGSNLILFTWLFFLLLFYEYVIFYFYECFIIVLYSISIYSPCTRIQYGEIS